MSTLEKEFVPYEIALALKELGFDNHKFITFIFVTPENIYYTPNSYVPNSAIWTPLYQQAFKFFREKYKYDITIPPSGDSNGNTNGYYYEIIFQSWDEGIESDSYDTYEEAELECLVKLIEIVKKQNLKG